MHPKCRFITAEKVKYFISTFNSTKSAGLDRIKPIVLKNLNDITINRLTNLFRASLILHYVPEEWRSSKVVIIPKRGKSDYSDPKSFRPISLSSFFFKLMEKVVKGHIENTLLTKKPLHDQQHAFRAGHLCDTALSVVVDCIESAILLGSLFGHLRCL